MLGQIRDLGFSVKLDTNGTNPEMLASLLQTGALDYVAMDIKNSPARYAQTCGGIDTLPQVKKSAALLMRGTVEYEFRTTVVKTYHTKESFEKIGQWIQGTEKYFLQNFVDSGDLIGKDTRGCSEEEMKEFLLAISGYVPNAKIRGI